MKNTEHKMKKSLGQNFLRDESVIEEIITVADLTADDTVFEVGPGDGALTEAILATGARVIALEIDADLVARLQKKFGDRSNFTLLHEDVRRFNLPAYIAQEKIVSYKVVANLPYYITSSIIRFFLESETPPQEMTVMVQKEVAQRICAGAGAMSILALSVQYFGIPHIMFTVPAEAFEPVPKVDSAIINVERITQYGGYDKGCTQSFFRIIRAGFSAKRKMLAKNLASSLGKEKALIEEMLVKNNIPKTARAQELSMAQWRSLVGELAGE